MNEPCCIYKIHSLSAEKPNPPTTSRTSDKHLERCSSLSLCAHTHAVCVIFLKFDSRLSSAENESTAACARFKSPAVHHRVDFPPHSLMSRRGEGEKSICRLRTGDDDDSRFFPTWALHRLARFSCILHCLLFIQNPRRAARLFCAARRRRLKLSDATSDCALLHVTVEKRQTILHTCNINVRLASDFFPLALHSSAEHDSFIFVHVCEANISRETERLVLSAPRYHTRAV